MKNKTDSNPQAEIEIKIQHDLPELNLNHLKYMTTQTGILQFSKISQPDPDSGYKLDDNAYALILMCMHYKLTGDDNDLKYIQKYFSFIKRCIQPEGNFLNYVDRNNKFTFRNNITNLDDTNGRAVWALGYMVSLMGLLPWEIISEAMIILEKSLVSIDRINSPRAMAFIIKGLYLYRRAINSPKNLVLVSTFADRMVRMYKPEPSAKWGRFEDILAFADFIIPEAMLYAWLLTGNTMYKNIARSSFNCLLSRTFNERDTVLCEQPIDVTCLIMALSRFNRIFIEENYRVKIDAAFSWFMGNNRLHHIVYNPFTGGCYDGLENAYINLNQGAESTISYLVARLTIEENNKTDKVPGITIQKTSEVSSY